MKLRDKSAHGAFLVVNKENGNKMEIDPKQDLTKRQYRKMMKRPILICQYAQYLKKQWLLKDNTDIAVHARIYAALNGRDHVPLIDPKVDLAAQSCSSIHPSSWIFAMSSYLKP